LKNSSVIPGKPSAGRGAPGIQDFEILLDGGFRRYDGKKPTDFLNESLGQDTHVQEFYRSVTQENAKGHHVPRFQSANINANGAAERGISHFVRADSEVR